MLRGKRSGWAKKDEIIWNTKFARFQEKGRYSNALQTTSYFVYTQDRTRTAVEGTKGIHFFFIV